MGASPSVTLELKGKGETMKALKKTLSIVLLSMALVAAGAGVANAQTV